MTTSQNQLDGRPLEFGDFHQAKLATMTGPNPVYSSRPNAPDFIVTCIRCNGDIRIRRRYDAIEEKMLYVTPRMHTCRCGARILLYRFNGRGYHDDRLFNHGEVVYRHCGAYEPVDEMEYINNRDSWKFYLVYNVLPLSDKVAIMMNPPGKTP